MNAVKSKAQSIKSKTIPKFQFINSKRILDFGFWILDFHRKTRGFTMVEVVVMLAIITALSALVLFSFTGLGEGTALNRSARELALAIRRTQNMAFAVTRIDTESGPLIPPATGVRLSTLTPHTYFIFADLNSDGRYLSSDDAKIGPDQVLERNIEVASLENSESGTHAVIHITFSAPEATVSLTDAGGNSIGEYLDITLSASTRQQTKNITVRTSGQISVK